MKKLNVFYMGERLCDVYPYATRFEVFKFKVRKTFKYALRYSMAGGMIYIAFIAGSYLNPIVTYAVQEKIVEVESEAPVLDRIAKCESNKSHFDKNGQVLVRGNNGDRTSVDVGKYQINMKHWGAKATELGLNLFDEKDNEKFAKYLYKNFGTEPWIHSKHCWNK